MKKKRPKIEINLKDYKHRLVLCNDCNQMFMRNSKEDPAFCKICTAKYIPEEFSERVNYTPLHQKDYAGYFFSDLGFYQVGRKKYRFATWFCNNCKSSFIKRTSVMKKTGQTLCDRCHSASFPNQHTKSRLFMLWCTIKAKTNPSMTKRSPYWKSYGSKSISLYDEWNDFSSFESWAFSNGYDDILVLHRLDTNKNFTPDNCLWQENQSYDQKISKLRSNNTTGYKGVKRVPSGYFVAQISVNRIRIHIGTYKLKLEAALAYDEYISMYNLSHSKNF